MQFAGLLRKNLIPILILSIGIGLYLLLSGRPQPQTHCIFTCSTFFDFKTGDRWDRFCRAMDTLQEHHGPNTLSKIDTWIVINEYSATRKADWAQRMRTRYPHVQFIQKDAFEAGQASTLNLCLRAIRGYTYWIHWEEAWEVRAPFLDDAFAAMELAPPITQLQFTQNEGKVNWLDVDPSRIHCEGRICRIDAAPDTAAVVEQSPYTYKENVFASWPLYSLLPSINRVVDYRNLGTFHEDPKLWPIRFEWDFARRWWAAGCRKAVLRDGPVWRPGKHTSTYAS